MFLKLGVELKLETFSYHIRCEHNFYQIKNNNQINKLSTDLNLQSIFTSNQKYLSSYLYVYLARKHKKYYLSKKCSDYRIPH